MRSKLEALGKSYLVHENYSYLYYLEPAHSIGRLMTLQTLTSLTLAYISYQHLPLTLLVLRVTNCLTAIPSILLVMVAALAMF